MVRHTCPQGITPEEVISPAAGNPVGERKTAGPALLRTRWRRRAGEPREPAAIPALPRDRAPGGSQRWRSPCSGLLTPLAGGAFCLRGSSIIDQPAAVSAGGPAAQLFWFERRRPGARELVLLACLCGRGLRGGGLSFGRPREASDRPDHSHRRQPGGTGGFWWAR